MVSPRRIRPVVTAAALLLVSALAAYAQKAPEQRASASAKPAAGYGGTAYCVQCHKKEAASFGQTAKGSLFLNHPRTDAEKVGCETCHGPGKEHGESGGDVLGQMVSFRRGTKAPVAERNAICLNCHQKTARTLWQGSTHESRNLACTDCHNVMHPSSERGNLKQQTVLETCGNCHAQKQAQVTRASHMPVGENKMECTSCHNPHGSANEKLLLASSTNETCFTCHAEKRGPFLWQHSPVVESCSNCHDPHGSNKEKLLKVARPRLCQQCHPTAHGGSLAKPGDAASVRFTYNKSCTNCHVNLHGSNHPAGAFFTR
jgi:DmsE family decaheme c-type cytochrome